MSKVNVIQHSIFLFNMKPPSHHHITEYIRITDLFSPVNVEKFITIATVLWWEEFPTS